MNKETKQILELIVEKGNKLREFAFEKHVAPIGLGFKGTRQNNWKYGIFRMPHQGAIKTMDRF